MYKKIAGLFGALSALVAPHAAQAMPAAPSNANEILNVQSYQELLDPIPNAVELLKTVASEADAQPSLIQKIQYYYHHHHHHWRWHHHHHRYWYHHRWYHHHHHHHYW